MTKVHESEQALPEEPNLPEAGGVAWVDLWGNTDDPLRGIVPFRINLTSRATTAGLALIQLMETIEFARDTFGLVLHQLVGSAVRGPSVDVDAAAVDAAFPPAPAGATAVAALAVPKQPAQTPLTGEGFNAHIDGTFYVKGMTVGPRADGKCKVDFMEEGHQYADVSLVLTPDALAAKLSHLAEWKPEHFKTAAKYQVNYMIDWVKSQNLNSAGNPYKNIVAIHRAD